MKRISLIPLFVCCGLAFGLAQETNQRSANAVTQPSLGAGTNGVPTSAAPPISAPAQRSRAELEKLAMPIALHPDPLIAIILPACAYPVEVVQAARFVKDTNNIPQVDQQPWDENVKAVAKFPDLIAQMDKDLAWTVELGKAFIEQSKELMDTIQSLRAKATKAGTLQTTPQQVVTVTNEVVVQTNITQVVTVTNQIVQIQPSNPQVIYVPTYSSTVYYPPSAYVYNPYAPLVTFGVGMAMGAVIANNCDWHGGGVWVGPRGVAVWGGDYHGDVDVDIDRNVNVNQRADINRNVNRTTTTQSGAKPQQQKWQPNQTRMQTAGASSAQSAEARGWGSGSSQFAQAQTPAGGGTRPPTPSASGGTRPSQPPASGAGGQPSAGTRPGAAARPTSPQSGARPSTPQQQPSATPPTPSASPGRSSAGQSVSRPSPQSSPAFSGVSSGGGARNYSSRGAASRGGGGGTRGGGGRR